MLLPLIISFSIIFAPFDPFIWVKYCLMGEISSLYDSENNTEYILLEWDITIIVYFQI